MKSLPLFLNRAVLAVAGALALGACSRGQYAVLPKAPAYLGSTPVAATALRPAARPLATAPAPAVETPEVVAAPATKSVAAATPATRPAASAASALATASDATTAAPAKPGLVQRLAVKKLTKKLDKLTSQVRQRDATAGTNRADGGLRQALVIGIIGLAIILLAALVNSGFVYVIGAIVLIVALVLLLLYLVNQL